MLLSADIHGIETKYGTGKRRKRDIKLHFQHQNDEDQLIDNNYLNKKKKKKTVNRRGEEVSYYIDTHRFASGSVYNKLGLGDRVEVYPWRQCKHENEFG